MMADQGLPVLVTGALDRSTYLLPSQGHGSFADVGTPPRAAAADVRVKAPDEMERVVGPPGPIPRAQPASTPR
jgi:hypothetical protein